MSAQSDHAANTAVLAQRTDEVLASVLAGVGEAPAFGAIVDATTPVVSALGDVAAVLSADFYDEARAEANVRGVFVAEPAPSPSVERVRAVTGWALATGANPASRLTLVRGGMVRAVLGAGRDTVRDAISADPAAQGWRRVASPSACQFCRMLAGRGEVYRKNTGRFASHDHCGCFASPAFAPGLAVNVHQYAATKRTVTSRDRARLREYLAS